MPASIFDTVTGLPVHILVVHAVVVLVPLAFLGVLVAAVSRTWRERLAVPILVLLVIALLASLVAVQSGRALRARIGASPAIQHHAHLGVWVVWFVLLAAAAAGVWFVVEERMGNLSLRSSPPEPVASPPSPGARLVACAVAVACCALATGWVAYTGDAGSRAVWRPIVQATDHRQ